MQASCMKVKSFDTYNPVIWWSDDYSLEKKQSFDQ